MNSGDARTSRVPERVAIAITQGAEAASLALSKWLGRPAHLAVSRVQFAEIVEATETLGPGDSVVAACAIPLSGPLPGTVLMTFDDQSAMAMVDTLLGRPLGTATEWGPMEQSAAQETANIVVCAFVNALAETIEPKGLLAPGPPEFRFEFAASLVEFALMDQMTENSQIVLVEIRFSVDGIGNDWALVIVPAIGGLEALGIEPAVEGGSGGAESESQS